MNFKRHSFAEIVCFLTLAFLVLESCMGDKRYIQYIEAITWTPDQKQIIFSYVNHRQEPLRTFSTINRAAIYKINIDGTRLKEIHQVLPYPIEKSKSLSSLDAKFVGWSMSKLLMTVYDSFVFLDVNSGQAEKLYQYPNFVLHDTCLINNWVIMGDNINSQKSSILFPVKKPDQSTQMVTAFPDQATQMAMEFPDPKAPYPPKVLSCSPDGKKVYYEITSLNDGQNVLERGVAEISLEESLLKNPKKIILDKSDSKQWAGAITWLNTDELLFKLIVKDPKQPNLQAYEETAVFHYSSQEQTLKKHFLVQPTSFAVSPDFKQVAFVEGGTIQISDLDGAHARELLDFQKSLPIGEPYIVY
jgi:hypothetical protein